MWPFLIDNLKEVIKELQEFAEKNYNAEETACPQRMVRLSTVNSGLEGHNNNRQPRPLCEITNDKHIFVRIHMWLVWILSAGARHFVEIFPMTLLDNELTYNLDHQFDKGFTLVNAKLPTDLNMNSQASKTLPEFMEISGKPAAAILRELKNVLEKQQFRQLLYSSLTGTQVLVRGARVQRLESLYGLSSLIPHACRRIKPDAAEYDATDCNFIGVDTSVAIPMPCATVCRLDIISAIHDQTMQTVYTYTVKWMGMLPSKLPTIMTKIETSLDNKKLGNTALKAHLAALQEEWSNIAKVVHAMRGRGHRNDLSELMLSLGAGPQDQKLLDAWAMGLPSNPA